jgi:hypothetical protein
MASNWYPATKTTPLTGHTDAVNAVAFMALLNGTLLLASSSKHPRTA